MPSEKQIAYVADAIDFALGDIKKTRLFSDRIDLIKDIVRRSLTAAEQAEPAPADPCKHPVWGQDNDGTRVCAKCGLVEHPAARSGAVKVNEPVVNHWPEAHEVADILAAGKGFWRSCSGCHELNEGHPTGPWSVTLGCNLGCGCYECGGIGAVWDTTDYADMGEALAALEPAEPEVMCVGCEGKPSLGNSPCAVCGKQAAEPATDAEREFNEVLKDAQSFNDALPERMRRNARDWLRPDDEPAADVEPVRQWPQFIYDSEGEPSTRPPESRLREEMLQAADQIERIAFAIPAPNSYTPQLASLAIAMRTAAHAQGADDERS